MITQKNLVFSDAMLMKFYSSTPGPSEVNNALQAVYPHTLEKPRHCLYIIHLFFLPAILVFD